MIICILSVEILARLSTVRVGTGEHCDAAAVRGDEQGVRAPRALLGPRAAVQPG